MRESGLRVRVARVIRDAMRIWVIELNQDERDKRECPARSHLTALRVPGVQKRKIFNTAANVRRDLSTVIEGEASVQLRRQLRRVRN